MFRQKILLRLVGLVIWFAMSAWAQAGATESAYRLQAGDTLEISVWKEDGLARELMVAPDGNISFPLVGQLMTKGLTVAELQKELATRISAFIPDPSVTVILKAATGSKFYVIGKVNRPGEFPLLAPISVVQALSIAGGMSTFAEVNEIRIVRKENGVEKTIRFRYGDIESGEKLEQNVLLQVGDVVVVP